MSPAGQGIFEALRVSLADFRQKVEQDPGHRIAAVGHKDATIPNLVRQVLSAVADALTWLAGALNSVAAVVRVADSVIALIEVAGDLLGRVAEGRSFGSLPLATGLDPAPFKAVGEAIATVNQVPSKRVRAAQVLPQTEDLAAIRHELELLLGRRANPMLPGRGSLGDLLSNVEKGPAFVMRP
jgi:hypothetical protein